LEIFREDPETLRTATPQLNGLWPTAAAIGMLSALSRRCDRSASQNVTLGFQSNGDKSKTRKTTPPPDPFLKKWFPSQGAYYLIMAS
jgi:hypothetical protein